MAKTITPNYERIRESYCYILQTAWVDYCKAYKRWLDSIWFNEKGTICTMYTEDFKKQTDEAAERFYKAQKDLMDFDVWVEMEKKLKGVTNADSTYSKNNID